MDNVRIEIIQEGPVERKSYRTNINESHIKTCPHCGESHQVLPFFAAMWDKMDEEEQYYGFHEPIETITGYWAKKDAEFRAKGEHGGDCASRKMDAPEVISCNCPLSY